MPQREGEEPQGLGQEEAERRLAEHGENVLAEKKRSIVAVFLGYFWGPIPWMIEAAAVLSAAVRHWEDFGIILLMLLINAGVGFFEEFKADTAIAALKKRLALMARVLRDGKWREIEARLLVPGDVVLLKLGNIVPADVDLFGAGALSIDQSALTGESLPVDRKAGEEAYSGSIVRQGEMHAVVKGTGMDTYLGRTARLVETAHVRSHFQQAVLRIGRFLIWITLGLVALIVSVALLRQEPAAETVLFALVLTVAAIPVALPAVLSVTLAVGAGRLARRKAIVSRLVSIEEMAGMDILCSDKTGTLTKNELTLGDPVVFGDARPEDVIFFAALTCDRQSPDAIDAAILGGLGDPAALDAYEEVSFSPFDPVRKLAEATVRKGDEAFRAAKGAPQVILDLAKPEAALAEEVGKKADALAARGDRAIGVARTGKEGKWRYLGLLPLFDPPREDSAETLAEAGRMGLAVKMVTGDHVAIGREIARKLGLGTDILPAAEVFSNEQPDAGRIERADGFAEVFPEHKFAIVSALQQEGHIVGMTGDGVNDAPALHQADVGIAVSGATDAARSAADLVLTAPGLSVIARAVEEARRIFERMNAYATFRIAETVRVLLFMTLSILLFALYPVTAVMIVLLAILNDVPIMTIAYDNVTTAKVPVRWDMRRVLTTSLVLGTLGVIASFGLFWYAKTHLDLGQPTLQTLIFLKLLVAGHLTIYVTRNEGWFWRHPWPNPKLILATETTQVLGTLAAVYGIGMHPLGWKYALVVWGYALAWFFVNDLAKILVYRALPRGRGTRRASAPDRPRAPSGETR